jgi:hypothetical protein
MVAALEISLANSRDNSLAESSMVAPLVDTRAVAPATSLDSWLVVCWEVESSMETRLEANRAVALVNMGRVVVVSEACLEVSSAAVDRYAIHSRCAHGYDTDIT